MLGNSIPTVLCSQVYTTFCSRLACMSVRVEVELAFILCWKTISPEHLQVSSLIKCAACFFCAKKNISIMRPRTHENAVRSFQNWNNFVKQVKLLTKLETYLLNLV